MRAGQASGPTAKQFAALKKQVASLSKSLKTVKAEANDADGFVRSCLISNNSGVLPINQFGDPAAPSGTAQGYHYGTGADPTSTAATPTRRPSTSIRRRRSRVCMSRVVDPACVPAGALHRQVHSGIGHLFVLPVRSALSADSGEGGRDGRPPSLSQAASSAVCRR